MGKEKVSIEFKGYWPEGRTHDIPYASGVYCVYDGRVSLKSGNVTPEKLIYIGEAENASKRIAGHDKTGEWKKHLGRGNRLCFSFARVEPDKRKRIEAALIMRHKPPANTEYKSGFPFETTLVSVSGDAALLEQIFTVYSSAR
jgi:excinuclease UvrABC nuclease subunit